MEPQTIDHVLFCVAEFAGSLQIWLMVSTLILHAMFDAVCDRVSNYFWDDTILYHIIPKKYHLWWDNHPEYGSWLNKYNFKHPECGRKKWIFGMFNKPVQLTDAWHFFKMLRVFSACVYIPASIVLLIFGYSSPVFSEKAFLNFLFYLAFCGVVWNVSFSLFYDYLLMAKTYKRWLKVTREESR